MKNFIEAAQYAFAALGGALGAVIFFYLSNEGISILENAARTGLPIPGKLKAVLEQLREEKEN